MKTYTPTTNPGDERTRARYLGITIPLDTRLPDSEDTAPSATIEILEQQVIRKKDGSESVLENLMGFNEIVDMSEEFEVINPVTDEPIGTTANVAQAFALIYSYVRKKQNARIIVPTE